jgi:hypothetical protein
MKRALLALLLLFSCNTSRAGGPRFVAGPAYGSAVGRAMAFYTPNVTYYTDPGDLNADIPHAQADAMVAAAAAPWNQTVALLTIAQGGTLSEHVSDQNTYFNGTQLVFPADVQASNYLARPIAVVYDEDGSVTDLLLGEGASSPSACHRNAVTESVDGFGGNATIQHAVILLNGRCVSSSPQQLLQMQYQLERAFGRVLGLAWSQVNDNVFTVATPVNLDQENNWPIMHPIDVLCSSYTYQCMLNPFQLRPDDISALALLYPVTAANIVAGKTLTLNAKSMQINTALYFADIQGMAQVDLLFRESILGVNFNTYDLVGGISGALYQRNGGNPVTGPTPTSDSEGAVWNGLEPSASMAWIPVSFVSGRLTDLDVVAESINPLYSGDYSVGIYEGAPVSLGVPVSPFGGLISSANFVWSNYLIASAEPNTCAAVGDGAANSPAPLAATGWWSNTLCPEGHVAWLTTTVQPGHSWTLETTAIDENGFASNTKMKPVVGIWLTSGSIYALPTIAATPAPFNAASLGMTQLFMPAAAQAQTLRIAIADALGQGRPDFSYKARLLYAAAIQPSTIGSGGGTITLTGTGFRAGNQVLVNGIATNATSWTATQIVAIVPSAAAVSAALGQALDVTVVDPSTAGTTTLSGALTYSAAPDTLLLVSAPASLSTGIPSTTPFSVQVLASDGTPAAAAVRFNVTGPATLAACASAPCTLTTAANGTVATAVTGSAAGSVTLTATEPAGGATLSVTIADADPVRAITTTTAPRYVAAGASVSWTVNVAPTLNALPAAGIPVVWTASNGLTLSAAQTTTDTTGSAAVTVQSTSLTAGMSATITGCAWTTVCAGALAYGIAAPLWQPAVLTGAGQSVSLSTSTGKMLQPVTLQVTDGAGHPLLGAPVSLYQTVDAWEGTCPTHGPCASAPVLASVTTNAVTDASGQLTLTPLQLPGMPQVVNIAASTGTQGFVALTLDITP